MIIRSRFPCNFCCCFFFIYFSIFFVILGVIIFTLIFVPQELKFTISDASLTKFEYISAPNNTLQYSLALNITVRNPNKKVGLYFRRVQVIPFYRKKKFSLVTLNSSAPFYQGHKNTTVLAANIQGQQLLSFKEKDLMQYNSETSSGIYSITLKLALRVRARYGKIKTGYYKPPKIHCDLKIPLTSSNGTSINGFSFRATKCYNVYILTNPDQS